MSIAGTRQALRKWGRTSRAHKLGFPSITSFMKERLGRSVYTSVESDPDIERIDSIVSRGITTHKQLLICHFCRRDSIRYLGQLLGQPKSTVGRWLDEAVAWVDTELQKGDANHLKQRDDSGKKDHPDIWHLANMQ